MNKLAVLLLLAGCCSQALAATRVTVQQVEQMLASAHSLPDAKLATKLGDLELTERASSARLIKWQTGFSGTQTREALMALADASSFLNLPAEELPELAAPDIDTQRQILSRVIDYAKTAIHKLPDFSALRNTEHFDDQQPMQSKKRKKGNGFTWSDGAMLSAFKPVTTKPLPLRVAGQAENVVTYRDGMEVVDTGLGQNNEFDTRETGLTTSGEFGPILSVVLGDAAHGQLFWSHWEQGASGPAAVFHYAVLKEKSHYAISLATIKDGSAPQFPAYHGEIAADPADGTILRITLVAELKPLDQIFKTGVMVEYGPVAIGNRTYNCPVRGVAFSRLFNAKADGETELTDTPLLTYLNDVSFTKYHLFRAETRILP